MKKVTNAPLFKLPYLNSRENYELQIDIGKVILITFWASWCPDSGRDMPKKEQLFQAMDHDQVKMLTINVSGRERSTEEAVDFAEKFITQPAIADRGREIYDLYNCQGVPTTVIIDTKGKVAYQFGDQASFMEIVEALGSLL
ncbi:TlpA family protein disulfide reductase [Halobacillus salinarum]|uniref:TlpA family protein disulfide reductase n=1 Tax=Halobacillus salinarum TaxID=2932257 RepID=A0ABY4EPA4_9BACI|nr:TlpA disulfide reductase family protein [Halobacillus salinarum]UOQ46024.1 TlpA family protein disulfide reductase [Halobacillus salinarum]